jgi:hypothetical protein
MKYLKKYKLFTEEVDFETNITDEPDLKMSKEKLETLKKNLTDYKTKKTLLDKAYLTALTDIDLKSAVDGIVGKTDALPEKDRNPFLVEYLHVANLKRKVDKFQKDITKDKISKDDFQEELSLATETSTKAAVSKKLTDINTRISTKTTTISSLVKDISDAQKALDTKMSNVEKEMMDYIKKISSETQK